MSKEDFTNALAYGLCEGSVEAVSPNCVDGRPGNKPAPCSYKVAKYRGRIEVEPCNCCAKCRNNCNWLAQVLDANKRESAIRRDELREMIGRLDDE